MAGADPGLTPTFTARSGHGFVARPDVRRDRHQPGVWPSPDACASAGPGHVRNLTLGVAGAGPGLTPTFTARGAGTGSALALTSSGIGTSPALPLALDGRTPAPIAAPAVLQSVDLLVAGDYLAGVGEKPWGDQIFGLGPTSADPLDGYRRALQTVLEEI